MKAGREGRHGLGGALMANSGSSLSHHTLLILRNVASHDVVLKCFMDLPGTR